MGFVFRSVFWLALASIVIPADMRFGGHANGAGGHEVSISEQIHDTADAAWGFAGEVARTCETNPSFCKAGEDLITTATDTGASLVREAQARFAASANGPVADASPRAQQHKKFQQRIE